MADGYMKQSKRDDWETPQWLFDLLNKEFGFTLDVCASAENAKCSQYFTKQQNALIQPWQGVCWMNPPYGRQIEAWIHKAWESAKYGATVVCLVPSRTDTNWWHDYVLDEAEVRFVKGRIKFVGAEDRAPFPNAIIIFRPPKEVTK